MENSISKPSSKRVYGPDKNSHSEMDVEEAEKSSAAEVIQSELRGERHPSVTLDWKVDHQPHVGIRGNIFASGGPAFCARRHNHEVAVSYVARRTEQTDSDKTCMANTV